jgi:hypothetical protein
MMHVDLHAIVIPTERLSDEPERSLSVTVPWVVGVQVIVVSVPAWIVPPVGALMGLDEDCAAASAAKAETMRASNFMLLMRGPIVGCEGAWRYEKKA